MAGGDGPPAPEEPPRCARQLRFGRRPGEHSREIPASATRWAPFRAHSEFSPAHSSFITRLELATPPETIPGSIVTSRRILTCGSSVSWMVAVCAGCDSLGLLGVGIRDGVA